MSVAMPVSNLYFCSTRNQKQYDKRGQLQLLSRSPLLFVAIFVPVLACFRCLFYRGVWMSSLHEFPWSPPVIGFISVLFVNTSEACSFKFFDSVRVSAAAVSAIFAACYFAVLNCCLYLFWNNLLIQSPSLFSSLRLLQSPAVVSFYYLQPCCFRPTLLSPPVPYQPRSEIADRAAPVLWYCQSLCCGSFWEQYQLLLMCCPFVFATLVAVISTYFFIRACITFNYYCPLCCSSLYHLCLIKNLHFCHGIAKPRRQRGFKILHCV